MDQTNNKTQILSADVENQHVNLQFNTFTETNKDVKNNNTNYPECLTCFGAFSLMVLMILVLCGWIVWAIFSIIALSKTSNSDIQDKCPDSNLWILLLILVIIGFVTNIITNIANNNSKEKENNNNNNVFTTLVSIGLIIWCGIELFSTCARNNLSDTTIYLLVEINFWTGVSLIGLVMCCLPCLYCLVGINNSSS